MTEGQHGTLCVGTAGELKGVWVEAVHSGFYFIPDGLKEPRHFDRRESVTFTPDPPTPPTRPLAVIETDDKQFSAILGRDGLWTWSDASGRETAPVVYDEFLNTVPWHVVFEGVDE